MTQPTLLTRRRSLGLLAIGATFPLAACAGGGSSTTAAPTAEPQLASDARVTARGTFEGRSKHVTTGHASIVFSNGNVIIQLEEDFTFDGAPDPKVALGNGGFDPETIHAALRSNTGAQTYTLKPGLDIGNYTEVWIWCEQFSVPLGVARLTLT
ncbi:MAG: DM13 domain-containing protein [Pseudomonadota bacterium]